ncbi:MAG TPA: DegT/DnrJ/EryC1/StrS family aminotransferase [Longimicrobiaceae bacterium]|jgi:dTDP-4-amino-4,6-dideoxygalactose transaminase|nr:DegT/DnrJ/EryC1/StrS family aminotransferase [Longimicrobiaceae bacterium]
MIPRRVPPAHSPVPARALAEGFRALLGAPPAHAQLRELVLREFGGLDVVTAASGTCALSLVLRGAALDRPRAPVALPAYGCYDLASAAVGAGVRVVLYDVDPSTLAPDAESFARALAAGPAAVVVAHLYGIPVDLRPLRPAVEAAGAMLIEDAAQGAGVRIGGRPAGGFGSASVLSFGRGKGVTGGGGGALLAHDSRGEAVLRRARIAIHGTREGWAELAALAAQWVLARPSLYALPAAMPFLHLGETLYREPMPPEPMADSSAAVLRTLWEGRRREADARVRNARRLLAPAARSGDDTFPVPVGCSAGWLRLPLRARHRAHLPLSPAAERLGIAAGYPLALPDLPAMRALCVNAADDFPGARRLAASLYTLPTHGLLSEADLRGLEAWLATRTDVVAVPAPALSAAS